FLNTMDLFLFPSKYEGLGIALIEAQANGLNCITSTEIPEESIVTNLVEIISLLEDKEIWVDRIIKKISITDRKDTNNNLQNTGYSIESTVRNIKDIYNGFE